MRCRFLVIESLSLTKYIFFKLEKSRTLFSFLFVFSMQLTVNSWYKVCRWLDSNHRPLVSEPTEPLHKQSIILVFHLNDDDVCFVLHPLLIFLQVNLCIVRYSVATMMTNVFEARLGIYGFSVTQKKTLSENWWFCS